MTTVKLGDVVQITSGFAFPSSGFSTEEGIPLVRIRDVTRGVSETRYAGPFDEDFVVNDGDLLVGMDGEFNAALWRGGRALLNQRVCRLFPDPSRLDFGFLRHALPRELKAIEDRTPFVTVKHLSVKDIRAIVLALPPLAEQRRIATILDKADTLRRKRQDAIQLADEFVQSLFFTTFGDVDTNTHGWHVCRLEDLALQVTDGEHQTPRRSAQGIKLLSARNVQNGFLALTDVDYVPTDEFERIRRRCEPRRGDILISCSGTIGRVAAVSTDEPIALVRSVALVRPDTKLVLTTFLEHYLRSATMQRRMAAASKSSAQANLFQGPIRALPVLLPPMPFQVDFEKRLFSLRSWRQKAADSAGMILDLGKSLQSKYFVSESAL